MSWSELERLVESAELEPGLRRALSHCRSLRELVLAARRLGFGIAAADLRQARELDRGALVSGQSSAAEAGATPGCGERGAAAQLPSVSGTTLPQSRSSSAAQAAIELLPPTVKPPLAS